MEQRRDIENTKPACRLILASASPRRRELLERIGLKPEIHPSTLEENPLCTEPAQVVMELAGQKARDVMAQVREEARTTGIPFSGIIIGSDTVVSVDDEILGKPADRDEALEMIGRIQGRSHRVYTGVAILTEDRESCFAVETRVDVYPMSGCGDRGVCRLRRVDGQGGRIRHSGKLCRAYPRNRRFLHECDGAAGRKTLSGIEADLPGEDRGSAQAYGLRWMADGKKVTVHG